MLKDNSKALLILDETKKKLSPMKDAAFQKREEAVQARLNPQSGEDPFNAVNNMSTRGLTQLPLPDPRDELR
ncbi:unnamed protein product [Protopolystoma xenopodis]|uniref:Uncharacterized protein n=1 Tax=Protopolystoma xenopodis TaxID=117903 RepID=A0A448WCR5_9PLAT|nr:unnamed protein product [Protopolystoma xenopodis]